LKKVISWLADNADAVIGLGLAVFASVLGLLGVVPGYLVSNVTVLTMATLAFVMLRDRHRSETSVRQIQRSFASANTDLLGYLAAFRAGSELKILVGPEITEALNASRENTKQLVFKGATGTFVRAVALPEWLKAASKKHRILQARIEIFDPGNTQLLESYVELYKSFADGPDDPQSLWSVDGTRREILATVLAACVQKERHRRHLNIEVYLSSSLTTFRWDLTSTSLIITQRGPRFPALFFGHDDPYYGYWETELHASTQAAKRLPLENASSLRLGERPEAGVVRDLFDCLGVPLPDTYGDAAVNELIQMALHERNPYQ
jgi:hypothetical protein